MADALPSDAPTEAGLGLSARHTADAAPSPGLLAGPRRLGAYEIERVLGAGGMGVVYRGRHLQTGEVVALKTASRLRASQLASIRTEVHALTELRHPGVVRVLGSGVEDGIPWYAMELLEGRTLHDYLVELWDVAAAADTGPLKPATVAARPPAAVAAGRLGEVLTLVRRLCEPLAYVHARGLVHRDLKPDNVFLRPDGQPVLMDFGLAAQFAGASGREVVDVRGMRVGTGWYMAPEQAEGLLVDARADLYSLGVMLYELLTGQRPFSGRTTGEVIEQHRNSPPRPPSQLVRGLSAALEELVLGLLSKRRRDRLGHADDVAEALVACGAEPGPERPAAAYLYRPDLEGRRELLGRLEVALERAAEGRGACLLLGGESGVGKSALAAALARGARLGGFAVVTGECRPLGSAAPLQPLVPLLLAVADHCLEQGPAATAGLLGPRGKLLERYVPALAALPGQAQQEAPQGLSAEAARERLFADLSGLLADFAVGRPLLLVLDDLQWADELTLAFLASLPGDFCSSRPLLLLGTYRSEELNEALKTLQARPWVQALSLGRLDRAAVQDMVGGMLALARPDEPLVDFLARHSEGNPFFVAEYLRTAVGQGLLTRDRGRWRLLRPPDARDGDLALPRTLRELVGKRLADLGAAAEELLAQASVLGREFDAAVLAAAVGAGEEQVIAALAELRERAVVEQAPDGALRFAHDKLREVAYERLSAERRRERHGRAARALEAVFAGAGSFELRAGELAHHWEQHGDAGRARTYFERAGVVALHAGAWREAREALQGALAHDDALRAGGDGLPSLARVRLERLLGEALYGLGRFPEARAQLDRSLRGVGRSLPAGGGSLLAGVLGQVARQGWHRLRGLDPLAGGAPQEAPEEVLAWYRLVHVFFHTEEMGQYVHANLNLLNGAERAAPSAQLAEAYALTCLFAGSLSLHGVAEWYWRRALAAVARLDSPAAEASVLMITSIYGTGAGQWERVRAATARGAALSDRVGDHRRYAENTALAAHAAFYCGDLERALSLWAALLLRARQSQPRCWAHCGAAENLLRRGGPEDAEAARRHAEAALDILRAEPLAPADEIRVRGVRALALLKQGEAGAALEAALETRERIAAHPRTTAFWTIEGAAAAAEVLLAALEREPGPALLAAAREVCRGLAGYAGVYPVGLARARWCEGRLLELEGRPGPARRAFARALAEAERLHMPFDAAAARAALSKEAK